MPIYGIFSRFEKISTNFFHISIIFFFTLTDIEDECGRGDGEEGERGEEGEVGQLGQDAAHDHPRREVLQEKQAHVDQQRHLGGNQNSTSSKPGKGTRPMISDCNLRMWRL